MFTTRDTQLIREHLPLVRRIAFGIARRLPTSVDLDDLVSAGTEGLLAAVQRYDVTRCSRFKPYASACIRFAVLDELRAYDSLTRYGRECASNIRQAKRQLEARLGRAPMEPEIAESLGMALAEYQRRAVEVGWVPGLSSYATDDDVAERELGVVEPTQETTLLRDELRARVGRAVAQLPKRTRRALRLYYRDERSQGDIARLFGVTESRVCQLLGEAATRLRVMLEG